MFLFFLEDSRTSIRTGRDLVNELLVRNGKTCADNNQLLHISLSSFSSSPNYCNRRGGSHVKQHSLHGIAALSHQLHNHLLHSDEKK
jgi:hypothetical protein